MTTLRATRTRRSGVALLLSSVLIGSAATALVVAPAMAQSPVPEASAGTPTPGGILKVGAATEPGSLDLHRTDDTATRNVFENVYDTLLAWSPDGTLVPSLATEWTVEGDTVYRLTLREDVVFHDGSPFTADDVVFTIERITDPETASPWAGDFAAVESVVAIDPFTVEFTLSEPFAPFLPNLARTFNGIYSATALGPDGDASTTVVGTGPYQFVEYVPAQRLVLQKNGAYWKPGLPYLDGIEWAYFPDAPSLIAALKTGVVDWTGVVPATDVEDLRASGFEVVGGLATNFRGLFFNTTAEPFDDPLVRRAVSIALDRQQIVDLAFLGLGGEPIVGSPLPPDSWAYGTFGQQPTADLDGARALLAEAGFPDGFTATLSVQSNFPFLRAPAEPIQAQLAQIGVNLELKVDEFGTFFESVRTGDYQVALFGNSGLADPDDYFYPSLHSAGGSNFVQWADPTFDALVDEGRTTVDQDARRVIYDELQAYLMEQVPIAYVYYSTQYEGFAPYVKGFVHWTNTSHLGLATTWLDR